VTDTRSPIVHRELRIEARPEVVFQYFVDPERIARWIGLAATVDARPGGDLRVAVAGTHPVSGQFVELDPPRRVVFTWGWEKPDYGVPAGGSRVEIDLIRDGDSTVLRLHHFGLPGDANENGEGWMHYLRRLAIAAAGGDPGPDPLVSQESSTTAPAEV